MKKFNKNSLLFIFAIVFIIAGICGNCFEQLKWRTWDLAAGLKHGNIYSFFDFKHYVDEISNKELSYHDTIMDVNSVKENLLGTRVVEKEDYTVVKSDSGSLGVPSNKIISKNTINETVTIINKLKSSAEANNACFLYCAAPTKENYEVFPSNKPSVNSNNYNNFLQQLYDNDIPFVDFSQSLKIHGIENNDIFFKSDHHWKPISGFVAAESICEKLSIEYGFKYSKSNFDLNYYNRKNMEHSFLGSYGKKVGQFFSFSEVDDIELIYPKFDTRIVEKQINNNELREGTFYNVIFHEENIAKGLYDKSSVYDTYLGGGRRLQLLENQANNNGKKMLIIRDSYSQVVVPYLLLNVKEIHLCDVRKGHSEKKINLEEYIENYHPDYVLVLYSGVPTTDSKYELLDFFV